MRHLRRGLLALMVLLLIASTFLAAYGFYSYRRPLPQTEGAILVPGLQERVTVYRDDWGVPHIYAATSHDLFFTQGYIHAQDRWWQMEMSRHIGQGRISEILGEDEKAQQFDRFARTIGWQRIAEGMWKTTSVDARAALIAYAAGVNAYIGERDQGELAMQYTILDVTGRGFEIAPWEPVDSLVWAVVLAWMQEGNAADELTYARLHSQFDPAVLAPYFAAPAQERNTPTIIQRGELSLSSEPDPLEDFPPIDYTQVNTTLIADLMDLPFIHPQIGSGGNSWVVAGSRTLSGKPLLASDPHMGVSHPSLWYSNGLHCIQLSSECPYNLVGDSLTGLPAIVAGHNADIAWSLINAGIDTQDMRLIRLSADDPEQYVVDGAWHRLAQRREIIQINDADPLEITIYESQFGTILSDPLAGEVLALRWAAPGDVIGSLLRINTAANWDHFQAALSGWTWSAQHFLYADTQGNIGYQLAGQVPLRSRAGLSPTPGWESQPQWAGFVPYDLLPRLYNPARGWIMITGQDAVPAAYWAWVSEQLGTSVQVVNVWNYAERAHLLQTLITNVDAHTVDSFAEIQGDTATPFAAHLLPFAQEIDFSMPEDAEFLDYQLWLSQWNQRSHIDSPQAALFAAFWANLVAAVFADEMPSQGLNRARQAILTLPSDHPWWDDQRTPEMIETREATLRNAFILAVEELQDRLGEERDQWRWGDLHMVQFRSQAMGDSAFGELVNVDAVGISGDLDSINAAAWTTDAENRYQVISMPAFRHIIDLGDFENSRHIHAPGQSGHPASPHYADMVDLWSSNQYHAMHWLPDSIEQAAASTLRLRPG